MSETKNPAISVVMPVHNGEKYLREAVDSILSQTFQDFEFIVIDDGSTDQSTDILNEYARKDARIRLISRENRGVAKSLNEAIALACGAYVARMDADDVSLPQRLEKQLDYLEANPDCVLLGAEVLMIDAQGWPIAKGRHVYSHCDIDEQLLRGDGGGLTHPVVMMRTGVVRRIGGYKQEFVTGQDLDLFLRLAEAGRIANLPDILLKWRQHPESINHTRYLTWGEMKKMALSAAAKRRNLDLNVEEILACERLTSKDVDHHLRYVQRASDSLCFFHTAIKHLFLSVIKGGIRGEHFYYVLVMMRRLARALFLRTAH